MAGCLCMLHRKREHIDNMLTPLSPSLCLWEHQKMSLSPKIQQSPASSFIRNLEKFSQNFQHSCAHRQIHTGHGHSRPHTEQHQQGTAPSQPPHHQQHTQSHEQHTWPHPIPHLSLICSEGHQCSTHPQQQLPMGADTHMAMWFHDCIIHPQHTQE